MEGLTDTAGRHATSCLAYPINRSCPSRCAQTTPCTQRLTCARPVSRRLAIATIGTSLVRQGRQAHWQRCNASAANVTQWSGPPASLKTMDAYSQHLLGCAAEQLVREPARLPQTDWNVLHGTPLARGSSDLLPAGAVLHIPSVGAVGFFVRANTLLAHAAWATSVGLEVTTATMQADPSDLYTSAHPWRAFFLPVLGDGTRGRAVQLDCQMAATVYATLNPYRRSYLDVMAARARYAELVVKVGIRPRPELVEAANSFWAAHFREGQSVLGVHLRGTDARNDLARTPGSRYVLLLVRRFARLARAFALAHPGGVVFAASDEEELLQLLRQRLSTAVRVVWREEATHSADHRAVHTRPRAHSSGRSSLATDAVVDMLLLGRSSFLLKAQSSLSEWSIYLNPRLSNASFDASLVGQPSPIWTSVGTPAPAFDSSVVLNARVRL